MPEPDDDRRTDDELGDLIAARSVSDGPAAAVEYCRELLAAGRWPGDATRAWLLTQLGAYSDLDGDPESAEGAYRDAVADGGPASPDARCYLAGWCFEYGDPAEGEALIAAVKAQRPTDLSVYEFVGEIYEAHGDLASATRWFTSGVVRALRDARESPGAAFLLLTARRRVRVEQGLPSDNYDEMSLKMHDAVYGAGSETQ